MEFTAIIKRGEGQFVALCSELDVVRQGHTVEEALANKEAVELYIEEMGVLEEAKESEPIIARFAVTEHAKAAWAFWKGSC